ncbi:MAG TPA: response regulator [bacterium]|nr:response regulator [bacterium]
MNEGKKILIVDDDEELHILYGLYLRGESFHILKAFNGQEALDVMEKELPDLIVLDMIMPVLDGEEFLKKMHHDPRFKGIPVIIASVNEKIPHKMFEIANIYTTLKKPFTIEILVNKIHEVFSHKQ